MNMAVAPAALDRAILSPFATPADKRRVFFSAPLVTPDKLGPDWQRRAFPFAMPGWAGRVMGFTGSVGVILGGVARRGIFMPPTEFAALVELTRFGGVVETQARPTPSGSLEVGCMLALPEADPVPLRALLSGAVEDDSAPSWAACDYAAANAFYRPNPRARDAARAVVMAATERLARCYTERAFGRRYADNLARLLATIDRTVPT